MRMPTFYIPHGGGPCFFMHWTMGPADTWERMRAWLASFMTDLPVAPTALLVVSAHWEAPVPTLTAGTENTLLFDYYGFPADTYDLTWPAPPAPELAQRVVTLLRAAGFVPASDARRGLDHGVFVPLKVALPDARIPTLQLSLIHGLDPARHLALGRALAPLRDEGVLIIGSGMSFHDARSFSAGTALATSTIFDAWLAETVASPAEKRARRLTLWAAAPCGRSAHPREEHLLPLMVVAGAAGDDAGRVVYRDRVMGAIVSAHQFGGGLTSGG